MNLKELLINLFNVCRAEENGSAEHITECISSQDVINVLGTLDKKEYGTIHSLISKFNTLAKDWESNEDEINAIKVQLKRELYKEKFKIIDKIFEHLKTKGKIIDIGKLFEAKEIILNNPIKVELEKVNISIISAQVSTKFFSAENIKFKVKIQNKKYNKDFENILDFYSNAISVLALKQVLTQIQ